ncbi:hypothetical protein BXZ70DRAFT_1004217 [Cristinia sonorae]|uniref:Uncharacterized protein n=1 Tax=Cristinia sonorae TaxID=1940300 RepID=A0A8K0UW70_9AGAR|nr:hypothetical protein BXZ70DRAFT_1004217 [Cristinia sonorae]
MDLPTTREIELETLLRQRDAQISELTDEVTHLRQHLSNNPPTVPTDPISLPPPLVSLLLPHINERATPSATSSSSNTVTAALTQRVKVLQDENDELYELLKSGETGRLKDEVRALQRVVQKLEGALKESHQVISSLSAELEKSQSAILANGKSTHFHNAHPPAVPSGPRASQQPPSQPAAALNGKRPPTAPRAHKKPRLSETHMSPANQTAPLPPQKMDRSNSGSTRRHESRERSPRATVDRKPVAVKMEVDADEDRGRARSPERARGDGQRNRKKDGGGAGTGNERADRNRARDRDRNRDRERDRDRPSRRNGGASSGGGGGGGGNGGGGGRRSQWTGSSATTNGSHTNAFTGGDRTLAERMGL